MQIKEILERASGVIKSNKNMDLAKAFERPETTISSWKSRGTIPLKLLDEFARKHNIELEWLLTGKKEEPTQSPTVVPWEIKELYNVLRKDIDGCQETERDIWKVINQLRVELEGLRKVLREVATTGDMTPLKRLGGKRK
jgi:hypothetical protein